MVTQQRYNKTCVLHLHENAPSLRAGIHPGDMIASVGGESIDDRPFDQVAEALKVPKGTHVQVTVKRNSQPRR